MKNSVVIQNPESRARSNRALETSHRSAQRAGIHAGIHCELFDKTFLEPHWNHFANRRKLGSTAIQR